MLVHVDRCPGKTTPDAQDIRSPIEMVGETPVGHAVAIGCRLNLEERRT